MGRRRQRLKRERRLSRLQQKLQETSQIKPQPANSVMIERLKEVQIEPEPQDLMKLLKADLLKMAEDLNCDVNGKNTKTQIVEAIEKQSE